MKLFNVQGRRRGPAAAMQPPQPLHFAGALGAAPQLYGAMNPVLALQQAVQDMLRAVMP